LGVLIIELVVSIELGSKFSNTIIKKHKHLVARRLEFGEKKRQFWFYRADVGLMGDFIG
jgi:hypothetical protein